MTKCQVSRDDEVSRNEVSGDDGVSRNDEVSGDDAVWLLVNCVHCTACNVSLVLVLFKMFISIILSCPEPGGVAEKSRGIAVFGGCVS